MPREESLALEVIESHMIGLISKLGCNLLCMKEQKENVEARKFNSKLFIALLVVFIILIILGVLVLPPILRPFYQ